MHFYTQIDTKEDGTYNCVVVAASAGQAIYKAAKHYKEDGYTVLYDYCDAVLFSTFEHGDYSDYEVIE